MLHRSDYPLCRMAQVAAAFCFCLSLSACNRAGLRIPGASLDFPETPTHYRAQRSYSYRLVVLPPVDLRPDHYGERIAGTRWTACSTDAAAGENVSAIIQERLAKEVASSKLFDSVSQDEPVDGHLTLRSEVHAFCSQVVGFLYLRVAGIVALNIVVERGGRVLFKEKLERVVTDADPQYTGSQVAFIEQAMRVTMIDSLRELLRDLLQRLERSAAGWQN
jgi:hypothetical protein